MHYARLGVWFGKTRQELLRTGDTHLASMARGLPAVMDEFFLSLAAAVWGAYKPQYQPASSPSADVTRAREQAALVRTADRHHAAMAAFKRRKLRAKGRQ